MPNSDFNKFFETLPSQEAKEFFEELFGPRRGEDLSYQLEIDFEDAVFGAKRTIEVSHTENCEHCHGSGREPGAQPIRQGFFTIVKPCRQCNGRGIISNIIKLKVTIPAGVDTGNRLRCSGQGNTGTNGGPSGDLYIEISIRPHAIFTRNGYDISCDVPVTFATATLGGEVDVPTITGPTTLNIPCGVQDGTKFKLKGKGIPSLQGDGCGDELVRILIEAPTGLSTEQEKRRREFDAFMKASATSRHSRIRAFMEKALNWLKRK